MDRSDLAIMDQRCGVVEGLSLWLRIRLHEADERIDAADLSRERVQYAQVFLHEIGLVQQILRRITGDSKLRKQHQISTHLSGALSEIQDLAPVFLLGADRGVDLGKSDFHMLCVNPSVSFCSSDDNSTRDDAGSLRW